MANATLAEYRASIQAKGYATDTAAQQLIAINSVRRNILSKRRWKFLETSGTLTAIVGNPAVALAPLTALGQLDTVRISTGSEFYDLEYLPSEEVRRRNFVDPTNGIPRYWSHYGSTLLLYPQPQSAYTLTVDYLAAPVDLAADADVDVIPRAHMDVVVWGAVVEIGYRERANIDQSFAQGQYDRRYRDMVAADGIDQRQSSGRVAYWRGWDQF